MFMQIFNLIFAHFLMDYPLQGDFIGRFKNRHVKSVGVPWYHLMIAHAWMHAGAVMFITDNPIFALIELIVHFFTDCAKCEGWINIHVDQAIHIGCKIAYAYYWF